MTVSILLGMRDAVIKAYSENHSYSATGRIFGVSRQYIHQIVTGYRTLEPKGKGRLIRQQAWTPLCKVCNEKKTQALHHKDGDVTNNTVDNLLPVCIGCHNGIHRTKRTLIMTSQKCPMCNRFFTTKRRWTKEGLCATCKVYNEKGSGKNLRPCDTSPICIDCKDPVPIGKRHKNRCHNCYKKWRYHNDPVFFARYVSRMRVWQDNNRERVNELQRIRYRKRVEALKNTT